MKTLATLVVMILVVGQSASAQAPTPGVFGTALELLPPGEPGELSIVVVGPYGEIGVPIIVRNNTEETVYDLEILATIRDANGTLIAAEESAPRPSVLEPGAIAIDRLPFWTDLPGPPPVGSTYAFEAYTTTEAAYLALAGVEHPVRTIPLEVNSAERSNSQIIGRAVNTSERPLTTGPTITVMCFTNAGEATEYYGASMEPPIQPIAVGVEFPFSTSTEEPIEAVCDRFLVLVYTIG